MRHSKQQVVPHAGEWGQKRWEMIPKRSLKLFWAREVLVLTKRKLQNSSLKEAISMVLGREVEGGGPAILSSECRVILIFKQEPNIYTFRSICTWIGLHPCCSESGLASWTRKRQPLASLARLRRTMADLGSRFQLFSDSGGANVDKGRRHTWPRLGCLGPYLQGVIRCCVPAAAQGLVWSARHQFQPVLCQKMSQVLCSLSATWPWTRAPQ